VDSEYRERDARAVEDPIAAVFELAESVDRETPKIRRALRYARWFVSLWLLLDFFLMIVLAAPAGSAGLTFLLFFPIVALLLGMRYAHGSTARLALFVAACAFAAFQALSLGGLLFLGIVLSALFVLGFVILELMGELRSFFDYFALRHRVIRAVRQADPVVHVPQGKDAAARILEHLSATDPQVRAVLATPGGLASPALLTGKSGLTYSFDAILRSEPSRLTKTFGIGPPGFAVYAKAFNHAPTTEDLKSLQRAVEDVSAAIQIPPARVFVLWQARGNESVSQEAYEFLTRETARIRIRGSTYACSLQLVREGDDGTYDFIPVIMEPLSPSARTAVA
jgi:hypothetical protein